MPGDDGRGRAVRQQLEVGVPDPGHVAAVGDVVVQEEQQALLAGHGGDGAQHLVEAGGVLAEEDLHATAVDLEALLAPERGVDGFDAVLHGFEVEAEREAAGERGQGVVGVVEAAQPQRQRRLALGRRDGQGRVAAGLEADGGRADVWLRAGLVAAGAAPVADVSVEERVIGVLAAAAGAPARVGGVLRSGDGGRAVVDAVEDDGAARRFPQRRHRRVVGVEHGYRRGRRGFQRAAPAGGDGVDLAVAVELVAEEVGEEEDARLEGAHGLRESGFVDLEDAEASLRVRQASQQAGVVEQGGGDAAHEVGAASIVQRAAAGLRGDAAEHVGGCGLAVGAGDDDGAAAELRRQPFDESGLDLLGDDAGERGAAAPSEGAAGSAGKLAGRNGRHHSHRHPPLPLRQPEIPCNRTNRGSPEGASPPDGVQGVSP